MTSSYWFCADVCHKVQDDTITAYNNSTHSEINCMACHMPANADPITFVLHKVTALGELYLTVTDNYEIPLNKGSHLAMDGDHMPSTQCTQCHSENRVVTPSDGIIIDHVVHEENEVHCTVCHNRIAHDEDGHQFVNVDPATGELNTGHPDFMDDDRVLPLSQSRGRSRRAGRMLGMSPGRLPAQACRATSKRASIPPVTPNLPTSRSRRSKAADDEGESEEARPRTRLPRERPELPSSRGRHDDRGCRGGNRRGRS